MSSENQQVLRLRQTYLMRRFLFVALTFGFLSPIGVLADNNLEQLREKTRSNPEEYIRHVTGSLSAICQAHYSRFMSDRDSKTMVKWYLDEMKATLKPLPEYKDATLEVIKIYSDRLPSCAKVLNSYE